MAEEKYPAGMRDEDGDLLSSSERAAMRDSEIKIPEDDAENTSSNESSDTRSDSGSSSSPSDNTDSTVDKAEETRVDIQKTEDDIQARYKDDKRYRIDPDKLTERQKEAINYNEPERSVGDPDIILTGQQVESRLTEGMGERIDRLDNFIERAEDRRRDTSSQKRERSAADRFVDLYGPEGTGVIKENSDAIPTEREVQKFNTLRERSAENALGIDNTVEEPELLPDEAEIGNKNQARRALAYAVQEEPQIADRARSLRNNRNQDFTRDLIEDNKGFDFDDVQQFNEIVKENQIQNDNLNLLVGASQASATSEYWRERLEGNPVSEYTGRLAAGLQLGSGEVGDIVTGNSRFEITDAERQESIKTQNEISSFVTESVSETAALPDLVQGGFGVAGRVGTGDVSGSRTGNQFLGSIGEAMDQTVQSVQEDPYEAGFKGALSLGAGATGYYGSTYLRTGRTPDLDLDASTLAKKGRKKARDIEESLRVTGEPVKSTDWLRNDPASIEDGKPVMPTGKESSGSSQGSSSGAFPLSMNQQTTLRDLLMGRGPKETEKTRDIFFVDEDKFSPGQRVKDGKQVNILEKTRPDQDRLEMQVDDVREKGTKSGFENLVDQDTDVLLKEEDVSQLVDVADDSGRSGRTRKGQVQLVQRDKTESESADTTGRLIGSEDRRQDVADNSQQFFDTTDDFDSPRNREFNGPDSILEKGAGSILSGTSTQDLGEGLNVGQGILQDQGQTQGPVVEEEVGPIFEEELDSSLVSEGSGTSSGLGEVFLDNSILAEEEVFGRERDGRRTRRPDFDSESDSSNQNVLGDIISDEEDFAPSRSVGASLLGLESDGEVSKEELGNPFNLRTGDF